MPTTEYTQLVRSVRSSDKAGQHDRLKPVGYLRARGTVREEKFFSRKLGVCCLFVTPVVVAIALALVLGPILLAVARHLVAVASIDLHLLHLDTTPQYSIDGKIPVTIEGKIKRTGIFPGKIYFREPVQLFWITQPPELREVKIGETHLNHIGVTSAGQGTLNQVTFLDGVDEENLSLLAAFLATHEEVTVKVNCSNVHVVAFGFLPAWKNIAVNKHVTFKGLDNLKQIKLLAFDIPDDDPAGGATISAIGSLSNPSPLDVSLGNVTLALSNNGIQLGGAKLADLHVQPGANTLPVNGRLFAQSTVEGLAVLGSVVDQLLINQPAPIDVAIKTPPESPRWIQAAFNALRVKVPVLLPDPLDQIKAVSVNDLHATVTDASAYSFPIRSSATGVVAHVEVPFGLSLSVASVGVDALVEYGNTTAARVVGATVDASSSLALLSPGVRGGLATVALGASSAIEAVNTTDFEHLIAATALNDSVLLTIRGTANAVIDSSLGRIKISALPIGLPTVLRGLGLLRTTPTLLDYDVIGGTTSEITATAVAQVINPSNITVELQTSVTLSLGSDRIDLGSASLKNVTIAAGQNNVSAAVALRPDENAVGFLNRFISSQMSLIDLTKATSEVQSLRMALDALSFHVPLPGVATTLLQAANITVTDETDVSNDLVIATPQLVNPFSAEITVTQVHADAEVLGIRAGLVDQQNISLMLPLKAQAQSSSGSNTSSLDATVNFFPPDIFGLFRGLVTRSGEDTAPLDYLLGIAGITTTPANLGKRAPPFDGFDLPTYLANALKPAAAQVSAMVTATVGHFQLPQLNYSPAPSVPLRFDETVQKLISPVGRPIIQRVVDLAILTIDQVLVTAIQPTSVTVDVSGSVSNNGPLSGNVSFPTGVQLIHEGVVLGVISLPSIAIQPFETTLQLQAELAVTNAGALQTFVEGVIQDASVSITVSSDNIVIDAYGARLHGAVLTKISTLAALNSLRGAVTLDTFDLPSSQPDKGIFITAAATVENPSQFGIQLNRLELNFGMGDSVLGILQPTTVPLKLSSNSTTVVSVSGEIQPQSGAGLDALNDLVNRFLNVRTSMLFASGLAAGPAEALWLNNAIKKLKTEVELPGQHFDLISAVRLDNITIDFTNTQHEAVLLRAADAQADISVPYTFPFTVSRLLQGTFDPLYFGKDAGQIQVADQLVQSIDRTVQVHLENAELAMPNGAAARVFADTLAVDAFVHSDFTLGLTGTTGANVGTDAGMLTINSASFLLDPAATITGLSSLSTTPPLVDKIDIVDGTKGYVVASVEASLVNPSTITIVVGALSFDLTFDGSNIGVAHLEGATLRPGNNTVAVTAQLKLNTEPGRRLIGTYLDRSVHDIQAGAKGSHDSTDVDLLRPALAKLALTANVPTLQQQLVKTARLIVPPDVDEDLRVQAEFSLSNPFSAPISASHAKATAFSAGTQLASVDANFAIHAPGHSTAVSSPLPVQLSSDISALIAFFIQSAQRTTVNIEPLLPLLQELKVMANLASNVKFNPSTTEDCPLGTAFDVPAALLNALQGTNVSVSANADASVGAFGVKGVAITQDPVSIEVDESLRFFIGPFGAAIVDTIAEAVTIELQGVKVSDISEEQLSVEAIILLRNVGPFAVRVEATKPIDLLYAGKLAAHIDLPAFCFSNDPQTALSVKLEVVNSNNFASLVADVINLPSVTLQLRSTAIQATVYGITFKGISIDKQVSLASLDGVKGVNVFSADVVGETKSTILVAAKAGLPISAPLSVDLPRITVKYQYANEALGSVGVGPVTINANTTNQLEANGQVDHLNTDAQTWALSALAGNFISGQASNVVVKGASAMDEGGKNIAWLTQALQSLDLQVSVPGKANLSFVQSVEVPDLFADLRGDPSVINFDFLISTNGTSASYKVPFPISVQPLEASADVVVVHEGKDSASVGLSATKLRGGYTTGNNALTPVSLGIHEAKLQTPPGGDETAFQALVITAVNKPTIDIVLRGMVKAVVTLAVGELPVNNVPLNNIATSLKGLDNVVGKATVAGPPHVVGGNSEYIDAELDATILNPSGISAMISTPLSVPAFLKVTGGSIGRAILDNVSVEPGNCTLHVHFHVQLQQPSLPDETAQTLVRNLVQPVPQTRDPYFSDIEAKGGPGMTELSFLQPALATLDVGVVLEGIADQLVQLVNIQIDILTLFSGPGGVPLVSANIDLENVLPTPLSIERIVATAAKSGSDKTYATIDHTFSPVLTLPQAKDTKVDSGRINTGKIDNIPLPMGLLASIDILGNPVDVHVSRVPVKIGGPAGYEVQPALGFYNVPATYSLTIGDTVLLNITSLQDIATGIFDNLSKIPEAGITQLLNGFSSMSKNDIDTLLQHGFGPVLCGLPQLQDVTRSLAGCPTVTGSGANNGNPSSPALVTSSSTVLAQTSAPTTAMSSSPP